MNAFGGEIFAFLTSPPSKTSILWLLSFLRRWVNALSKKEIEILSFDLASDLKTALRLLIKNRNPAAWDFENRFENPPCCA
jgi:hypothetical protein